MRGLISFHPIDTGLFEQLIEPLVQGQKVNPETYLRRALRQRSAAWHCLGYKRALRHLLEQVEAPAPRNEGGLWDKVSSRIERLAHRPEPLAVLLKEKLEHDLHLEGRPFLVTEGSADHVAQLVHEYADVDGASDIEALICEQLVRLDPMLGGRVEPFVDDPAGTEMAHKSELLAELRTLYDLGNAARSGDGWAPVDRPRRPAMEILAETLPHLALRIHAHAVPFWVARDVDGLDTICDAAGIPSPPFLTTARELLPRALDAFPELDRAFHTDLRSDASVGTYVPPSRIDALLEFLNDNGARIIQAASRHGEGAAAGTLLRKIRECAAFAKPRSLGYLEGSGIVPTHPLTDE